MSCASGRSGDETIQVICHELRGALGPIATWARLLQSADLDPKEPRQAGEVIQRSLQVVIRLCDDLLALRGDESAPWPVAPVLLDLRDPVRAAVEAVAGAARMKGVPLTAQVPAQPVQVLGDAVRLGQVVSNLLENALKFTDPPGTVTVELAMHDGQARLAVADTGAGIGPGFLPHVFEKFTREAGGTGGGLGLHVVQRLVELHGGTVQAESPGPGRGSRFLVTLPVRIAIAA